MKKRYVVILVILGILIIAGISFAYFTATTKIDADISGVTVQTATIEDVGLVVEGTLTFNDEGILPGHKNVSAIKVTATAENKIIEYNLIWKGKNAFQTGLKYYVYRSKTPIDPTPEIDCTKTQSGNANYRKHFEVCKEYNFEDLGEVVATGNIDVGDEVKTTLLTNEVIKGTKDGTSVYYYVVLEFVNKDEDQEIDINGEFDGIVTVEEAENTLADITIGKIYLINEDGEKSETTSVPTEGYTLDKEQSSCEGNATLDWDNYTNSLMIHATQSGAKCDIAFKEYNPYEARDKILADNEKPGTPTFTGTSCENDCIVQENGIYTGEDDFGTSYVYRGTVNNNWLVFGQENDKYIWWRIIRINGNGTIRLIYAGTSSSEEQAPESIGVSTLILPQTGSQNRLVDFNSDTNDNKYVGYMYNSTPTTSGSLNDAHKVTNNSRNSTILGEIVNWYNNNSNLNNLIEYMDVETGFCSDATLTKNSHGSSYPGTSSTLGYGKTSTAYAGTDRVWSKGDASWRNDPPTPTLKCGYDVINNSLNKESQKRDLYTGPNAIGRGTQGSSGETIIGNNALPVPVGLITMDEVIYAGGNYGTHTSRLNKGYWLYNNNNFWTMTPCDYGGNYARLFVVNSDGQIYFDVSNGGGGIRPVINLKSDIKLSGNGVSTDPYIVEGVA